MHELTGGCILHLVPAVFILKKKFKKKGKQNFFLINNALYEFMLGLLA